MSPVDKQLCGSSVVFDVAMSAPSETRDSAVEIDMDLVRKYDTECDAVVKKIIPTLLAREIDQKAFFLEYQRFQWQGFGTFVSALIALTLIDETENVKKKTNRLIALVEESLSLKPDFKAWITANSELYTLKNSDKRDDNPIFTRTASVPVYFDANFASWMEKKALRDVDLLKKAYDYFRAFNSDPLEAATKAFALIVQLHGGNASLSGKPVELGVFLKKLLAECILDTVNDPEHPDVISLIDTAVQKALAFDMEGTIEKFRSWPDVQASEPEAAQEVGKLTTFQQIVRFGEVHYANTSFSGTRRKQVENIAKWRRDIAADREHARQACLSEASVPSGSLAQWVQLPRLHTQAIKGVFVQSNRTGSGGETNLNCKAVLRIEIESKLYEFDVEMDQRGEVMILLNGKKYGSGHFTSEAAQNFYLELQYLVVEVWKTLLVTERVPAQLGQPAAVGVETGGTSTEPRPHGKDFYTPRKTQAYVPGFSADTHEAATGTRLSRAELIQRKGTPILTLLAQEKAITEADCATLPVAVAKKVIIPGTNLDVFQPAMNASEKAEWLEAVRSGRVSKDALYVCIIPPHLATVGYSHNSPDEEGRAWVTVGASTEDAQARMGFYERQGLGLQGTSSSSELPLRLSPETRFVEISYLDPQDGQRKYLQILSDELVRIARGEGDQMLEEGGLTNGALEYLRHGRGIELSDQEPESVEGARGTTGHEIRCILGNIPRSQTFNKGNFISVAELDELEQDFVI